MTQEGYTRHVCWLNKLLVLKRKLRGYGYYEVGGKARTSPLSTPLRSMEPELTKAVQVPHSRTD